jgi:F-type H+-transporting ATPase subunit delta
MNTGPIAHRYAKALLKYVQETGAGEEVYSQAAVLVLRMQELRQFADAVQKHPELPLDKKRSLLDSALGTPMAEPLRRFTALVYAQGRIEIFERMLYSFMEQYRAANGLKIGRLVTAVPVPGLKERLQVILGEQTGATVLLESEINSDILGGFILNIDDLRMDASVDGQLRLLRRKLIDSTNRIV